MNKITNYFVALLLISVSLSVCSQPGQMGEEESAHWAKLNFSQVRYIERIDSVDSVQIANLLPLCRFDEVVLPKKERIHSIDELQKRAAMVGGSLMVVRDSQEIHNIKTSLLEGTSKSLFGVNPVKVNVVYGSVYGKPPFGGDTLRQVLSNKTWRWYSSATLEGYEVEQNGKQYFFTSDGKLQIKGKDKGRYGITREGLLVIEENGKKTVLNILKIENNKLIMATLQPNTAERRVFVLEQ